MRTLALCVVIALVGCMPALDEACQTNADCPSGRCETNICVPVALDQGASIDGSTAMDLGRVDAAAYDEGVADARRGDAQPVDASPPADASSDASAPDAGVDAHVVDAQIDDAAILDAQIDDAAIPDAAIPDAAIPDAAIPDAAPPPDGDNDGVEDLLDNCPTVPNAAQINQDTDEFGDACDCAPLDAEAYPGAVERCNAVDDDCDGVADNGVENLGEPCGLGQGICQAEGVWRCVVGGGELVCDATVGEAAEEICNGLDDDCDGEVDNDLLRTGVACTVGLGVCQADGGELCDAARWICDAELGVQAPESCDGLDNDCDGETDEGAPAEICADEWPHAVTTGCADGACAYTCDETWFTAGEIVPGGCDRGCDEPEDGVALQRAFGEVSAAHGDAGWAAAYVTSMGEAYLRVGASEHPLLTGVGIERWSAPRILAVGDAFYIAARISFSGIDFGVVLARIEPDGWVERYSLYSLVGSGPPTPVLWEDALGRSRVGVVVTALWPAGDRGIRLHYCPESIGATCTAVGPSGWASGGAVTVAATGSELLVVGQAASMNEISDENTPSLRTARIGLLPQLALVDSTDIAFEPEDAMYDQGIAGIVGHDRLVTALSNRAGQIRIDRFRLANGAHIATNRPGSLIYASPRMVATPEGFVVFHVEPDVGAQASFLMASGAWLGHSRALMDGCERLDAAIDGAHEVRLYCGMGGEDAGEYLNTGCR